MIAKGLNTYVEWDGGKGMRGEDGGRKKGGDEKRGKKSDKVVFGLSFLQNRAGKDWYDLNDKISQMKSKECSLHQLLGEYAFGIFVR